MVGSRQCSRRKTLVAVGCSAPGAGNATRAIEDAQKAYENLTGSKLQPHVDIGNAQSYGARMEERMKTVHPVFAACVQSQFVCRSVPRGGATLVVSPGDHYRRSVDPDRFLIDSGRDFCVCSPKGYDDLRETWRAVEAPRGCLILWLSRTPHGNKLADVGVDPKRRVVYISWQARALVERYEGAEELRSLKRKKMDAVYSGASTDHWATHVPKVYRGSHYSNGKGITNVLYTHERPPAYDDDLAQAIEAAF